MELQKTTIKEYVTILDNTIEPGDLLDIVVDLTIDRVLLYLNETALDIRLDRIIAQVVVSNYHAIKSSGDSKTIVSRVEDNGQAVTYKESVVRHFSSGDDAIFSGFEGLLKSYRRVHVITS